MVKRAFLEKGLPFLFTLGIIAADQAVKNLIAVKWPVTETGGGRFIADVFHNGLLHIVHVRNTAVAFSLGSGLPDNFKHILFIILPILALGLLVFYYFKSGELTTSQRWTLCGILGGGAGNLIDRIYPHGGVPGVVDFISVKFWGIFGMERWPTFNIADAIVVCCVIFWFITTLFLFKKERSHG